MSKPIITANAEKSIHLLNLPSKWAHVGRFRGPDPCLHHIHCYEHEDHRQQDKDAPKPSLPAKMLIRFHCGSYGSGASFPVILRKSSLRQW
jgi:hypothetical protein